jgi:hypothetical protein
MEDVVTPEERRLAEVRETRARLEEQLERIEAEVEEEARAAARAKDCAALAEQIAGAERIERELLDQVDLARLAKLQGAYETVLARLLERLRDLDADVQDLDLYAHACGQIEQGMSARGNHQRPWQARPVDLGITTAGSIHALQRLALVHGLFVQAVLPRGA